tara:strand:- start:650 stop:1798 length:1149 start_codon:yes stop_codon:yes gene_type:complete
LLNSIKRIDQGSSIDTVISTYPKVKRSFLFLVIQEYYRNYENHNQIIYRYTHSKTPKKIIIILKISLTLLFFSDKPTFSIVNDAVEESKFLKKEKLVNAVLRNILRKKNEIKHGNLIYPYFKKILDKIFSSNSIREYIYSTLFTKPKNYQISLSDKKDAIYGKRVFILEKKIMKDCFVQDIGNFEVINSIHKFYKDKNLIDVCAAPGGKSILLQSLGFNITAIDKSQIQLKKFNENISRLKIKINILEVDFLKNKFNNKYNSILLDAPCSALGTFRRNPDVTLKIDKSMIKKHQKIQIEMIEKSLKILNIGGFLAYVVCSFHPFETINVIDKIIQKHKTVKIHNIKSDKMIKRQNGYFINPLKFKKLGGSDIFFVSILEKIK